jgi:hypothetical protein
MLSLPPIAPVTGWRRSLRLPRDHYVRLDSNNYSVHPAVIGRGVEIRADLERVQAFCDGRLVADHPRCWARHQTISDPGHLAAAAQLRHDRAEIRAANRRDQGEAGLELGDYDLVALMEYSDTRGPAAPTARLGTAALVAPNRNDAPHSRT